MVSNNVVNEAVQMIPNPGGEIASNEVIGRDETINLIWNTLEVQSVRITSERRVGKTSILKKMRAEPRSGYTLVYRDLEHLHTPKEFAESVYEDACQFLSSQKKTLDKAHKFLQSLSGFDIKVLKLPEIASQHWKTILDHLMSDLNDHQAGKLIFQWDELPMMLDNIQQRSGEETVMEVLNTLRHLRQTYPNIRMIYTGSIGLHHVITALRKSGYSNAPLNDMYLVDIDGIEEDDAIYLAASLIEGANIRSSDRDNVAKRIAVKSNGIPFYIHHVVRQLSNMKKDVTEAIVDEIFENAITDPNYGWEMDHFITRIDTYYKDNNPELARAILDAIAFSETPLSLKDIQNAVASQYDKYNIDQIRDMLKLLQLDHYIHLVKDSGYAFTLSIIKSFWRVQRGE